MHDDILTYTDPIDVTSHGIIKISASSFALTQNFVSGRRCLPNFSSQNHPKQSLGQNFIARPPGGEISFLVRNFGITISLPYGLCGTIALT